MNKYLVYSVSFPNGKMYVGITSRTLKERVSEHYKTCRKYAVHNAIKKYKGQETWTVIKEGLTKEAACKTEKGLITLWETKVPNGYNLTDGGEGTQGHKDNSFETKVRMYKPKVFEAYKLDGTFVGEFTFQADAARTLDLLQPKIYSCLIGKVSQTQGYRFKYKDQDFLYKVKKPTGGRLKGYRHSEETRKKISNSNKKKAKT